MRRSQRNSHLLFAILMAVLLALPIAGLMSNHAAGGEAHTGYGNDHKPMMNAWKTGLLISTFLSNSLLRTSGIDATVSEQTAVLQGEVDTAAKRDLAEALALDLHSIAAVENALAVEERGTSARVGETFSDAVITTRVKSKLLANSKTRGLKINVVTRQRSVTLTGEVPSRSEKQLAQQLAHGAGGVRHVIDELEVGPQV